MLQEAVTSTLARHSPRMAAAPVAPDPSSQPAPGGAPASPGASGQEQPCSKQPSAFHGSVTPATAGQPHSSISKREKRALSFPKLGFSLSVKG